MDELLLDLHDEQWDVILVSETWRKDKDECFSLEAGHVWFGSAGKQKQNGKGWKHGVGILLHRRWSKVWSAADAVSERLINIDMNVGKYKLRIISAYMPHGGYPDSEVEGVYVEIEKLIKTGRARKRLIIVGGDWNAEVGAQLCDEEAHVIGNHGVGKRNARGQWLAGWSGCNGVVLANTLFRKRWEHQWTHEQDGRRRVIDYIGIDSKLRKKIRHAEAKEVTDLRSDHRAVHVTLRFEERKKAKHGPKGKQIANVKGWMPKYPQKY
jgi:exonuclease III